MITLFSGASGSTLGSTSATMTRVPYPLPQLVPLRPVLSERFFLDRAICEIYSENRSLISSVDHGFTPFSISEAMRRYTCATPCCLLETISSTSTYVSASALQTLTQAGSPLHWSHLMISLPR